MKEKFTDWSCIESEVGPWFNIEDSHGGEVCTIYGYDPDHTGSNVSNEAYANAHLIAAAPKMYAMLEQLKAFTEDMHIQPTGDTIKESVRLHKEAQKLLAEARGE